MSYCKIKPHCELYFWFQVKVSYEKEKKLAKVENLGKRHIVVNQTLVPSGQHITMQFGDVLELLPGKYCYQFEEMEKNSDKEETEETTVSSSQSTISKDKDERRKSSTEPTLQSKPGWIIHDKLMVYCSPNLEQRSKIASFDVDGTLIATQSGARFPKDDNDWRILYPEIPGILKETYKNGYKIVLFTNQKGISLGRQSENGFKSKIESIQTKFGVPLQCFVSLGDGMYRKPLTGMWDNLEKTGNYSITIDRSESFYVGDAAGREENKKHKRKKDHSCADRLFALNLNVKFYTPEQFFLKDKTLEPYSMPNFDPKSFTTDVSRPLLEPNTSKLTSDKQEIIVLVGYPASGKSTFVETCLSPKGYVSISRDELKSWHKCVNLTEKLLKEGKSVVIDNTNPDIESRARYISLAQATKERPKIHLRCFLMNVNIDQARHNNKFRELAGLVDSNHKGVTDMVLYTYRKNFQEPQTSEGFDEVVKVNVIPKFDDQHLKNLYSMYLLEK